METIEHAHYQNGKEDLQVEVDDFRPGHIVITCGPSGVGKTHMRHAVMRESFGNPLAWGKGCMPAIEVFAKLPTAAFFNSMHLSKSLVTELQVPSLNWLTSTTVVDENTSKLLDSINECSPIWEKLRKRSQTEEQYWETFQRLLKARQCKYISIDQVTALLVNRKNTEPTCHIEHLLSIAEESKVMFIMTGIHTVTKLWQVHSELRRRISTVWVPPYSPHRREDDEPYLRLLKSLSSQFPMSSEDLLLELADDFMAATAGVFAEMTQLLDRAWKTARGQGKAQIARNHIEASYYGGDDLDNLWRDVEAFEAASRVGDVSIRSGTIRELRKQAAKRDRANPGSGGIS